MNKNIIVSKVFTGGEGLNELTVKNSLSTNNLNVSGTLTIPQNSLSIGQIANLQDNLNNISQSSSSSNSDISDLKQATTNITYGGGYTNIPNLYLSNNLLMYDNTSESNVDVLSTFNSVSRKTSNITVDGSGKTSIVELSVSNKLSVYDQVGGYKDIIYTLDSQQDRITTIKASLTTSYPTKTNLETSLLEYALKTDLNSTNTTLINNYALKTSVSALAST